MESPSPDTCKSTPEFAATCESSVALLDQAPQHDEGPTELEALVPVEDLSTYLYGHSDLEANQNETLRRSWRRSSTLMNLLSEHNVQRIRMMFDAKTDAEGLSLSEFLFVLHKCLVRSKP
mgnify:FL=1